MLPDDIGPKVTDLLAKLDALGDSRAIALHLIDCGVRGVTLSPTGCALAQYLQSQFPGPIAAGIGVGSDCVHTWERDADGQVIDECAVDIPPEVQKFIHAFDNGLHPELLDASHPSVVELYS